MTRLAVFSAAFLAVLAPAAHVAADDLDHERPDVLSESSPALFVPETKMVRADLIQSDEELHRRGVDAEMLLTVSAFSGSGIIDPSGREY